MLGAIYEDVMISSYERSNQKYVALDKYNLFTGSINLLQSRRFLWKTKN